MDARLSSEFSDDYIAGGLQHPILKPAMSHALLVEREQHRVLDVSACCEDGVDAMRHDCHEIGEIIKTWTQIRIEIELLLLMLQWMVCCMN
jgi:hypothetical protein